MKYSNRPRMEPNDGPRRLKGINRGKRIWFTTEAEARRHWHDLCSKILQYSPDDARATIEVTIIQEPEGWALHGVIHPARLHYRMALEERGVLITVGVKGPHWHRLNPKSADDLMQDFKRKTRGRTWM